MSATPAYEVLLEQPVEAQVLSMEAKGGGYFAELLGTIEGVGWREIVFLRRDGHGELSWRIENGKKITSINSVPESRQPQLHAGTKVMIHSYFVDHWKWNACDSGCAGRCHSNAGNYCRHSGNRIASATAWHVHQMPHMAEVIAMHGNQLLQERTGSRVA